MGQDRLENDCSCAKFTCKGKMCKDSVNGKECNGTLAPDCAPGIKGLSPNGCGVCCNETCESMGYKCGKFSKCGVPGALVCGDTDGDGEPDCGCTDTCYIGNKDLGILPETRCLDNKIYTCGQDADDKDKCYEFVDDPEAVINCPEGCEMKDEHNARCLCKSGCPVKGTYCNNNKFGSFLDLCVEPEEKSECLKKIKNYYKCEDGCVEQKPGYAKCECVDECSLGQTKCEAVSKIIIKDNRKITSEHYFKYTCGEANDFDDCTEWVKKTECSYGCNSDLNDCAKCRSECDEGDVKCVPYDSDGDGVFESTALYSCGFKDNKDRCRDWIGPEPCLNNYYCKVGQKADGCFCVDCVSGETKEVEYPIKRWEQTNGVWGWRYVPEPRTATCKYDSSLGCKVWSDIGVHENILHQGNASVAVRQDACISNCGTDGFSSQGSIKCQEGIDLHTKVGYRSICEKDKDKCLTWNDYDICFDGCEKVKMGFGYFNTGNCNAKTCKDDCNLGVYPGTVCTDGILKKCFKDGMDGDSCADLVTVKKCYFGCLSDGSDCASEKCECNSLGEKHCIDNKIYTCTDKDRDGCFKWSDPQECKHGCKVGQEGSDDQCAYSCKDINECNNPGNVCQEKNGIYSLYTCGEAYDGDDCLDILTHDNPQTCRYGCTPFKSQCNVSCDNDCKAEGQLICKDMPWLFGTEKSYMFVCKKSNPNNICFDLVEKNACEFGCNMSRTACLAKPDKCVLHNEKCVKDNMYICTSQPDGSLDWSLKRPPCENGCSPETNQCNFCRNEEGCFTEGQYLCEGNTKYQCKDTNRNGCLEKVFFDTCEYGCPIPNPYFSSQCNSNTCRFDCKNPGPPYDDKDPNNPSKVSFSCGKFFICGMKDYNGKPAFDCGECPNDCRSVPLEQNHIRYNDSVCEYMWDGQLIFSTNDVKSCYDLTAEKDIDDYMYLKGVIQTENLNDGFTYYEICRETGAK